MAGSTSLHTRLRHAILLIWTYFLSCLHLKRRSTYSLRPLLPVADSPFHPTKDAPPRQVVLTGILRRTSPFPPLPVDTGKSALTFPIARSTLKAATIAIPGLVHHRTVGLSVSPRAARAGRTRVRFVEPTVTKIDDERADLVRMQDIEEAIVHFQARRAARRERREGRVPTAPYATLDPSPTSPPSPAYLEVPTYIIEPISSLKDLDPEGTALGSPSASPLMASTTAAWDGYSILDSACSSDASAVPYLSDASTATEATPRLPYNEPSQDLEVPRLAFSFESDAEIVISPLQFEFNTHLAPFPAENAPATDMTLSLPPFSPFEAKAFSALSVGLADHCGSLATAAFGYTPASSNAAPLTSTPRLFPTSRSPAAKPRAMSMLQLPAMTRDEGLTYAEILDWSVYDRPLSLLVSECSAYTADADLTATIAPGGLSVPQARSASPKPSPSRAFGRDLSNQRTTPVRGVKASHKPGRANLRSQPPSPLAYPRAVNIGAEDLDNGDFATKYELLLAGLQSPALGAHDGSRALSEYAPQERSEYDIRISAVLGELQCAYEHLSMREWDENQFRRVFA